MAANTIIGQKIVDNNRRALIKLTYEAGGSQVLSNNIVVDVSTLAYAKNANGYIMTDNTHPKSTYKTQITRIFGQAQFSSGDHLKLQWHGTNNTEIVMVGNGRFDFNLIDPMGYNAVITNPETNNSGDILISTTGSANKDCFTLFIDLKKDGSDYDQGQTRDPTAFNNLG